MLKDYLSINNIKKNFLFFLSFISIFLCLDTSFDDFERLSNINIGSASILIRLVFPYLMFIIVILSLNKYKISI